MLAFQLFSLLILFSKSFSKLDLFSDEIMYISSRLTIEECRKLVASLHFDSFELPKHLAGEGKLV